MEIQKAVEFVATIAKEGCYFNSSGDFKLSTNMTAPLIRSRDKAIINSIIELALNDNSLGGGGDMQIEDLQRYGDAILCDLS
jgi:hypothetical protein